MRKWSLPTHPVQALLPVGLPVLGSHGRKRSTVRVTELRTGHGSSQNSRSPPRSPLRAHMMPTVLHWAVPHCPLVGPSLPVRLLRSTFSIPQVCVEGLPYGGHDAGGKRHPGGVARPSQRLPRGSVLLHQSQRLALCGGLSGWAVWVVGLRGALSAPPDLDHEPL